MTPTYELLDLLPTQRSQITYWHGGDRYVVHPDASFQLSYQGYWDWRLLEYERRAVTPRRVLDRLRCYRRYFGSGQAERDHGGLLPLCCSCSRPPKRNRPSSTTPLTCATRPSAAATCRS